MEIVIISFFIISVTFPVLHLYHCLPWFSESGERVKRNPKLKNWMIDHGYENEKGISILIPCFNETGIIETSIEGMKSLSYSNFDIFYINDGSTDETMEYLHELLHLKPCSLSSEGKLSFEKVKGSYQSEVYPNIYVIDKKNGGKADALNAGIEYSRNEVIITLDADTILAENALSTVNDSLRDERIVAAGGMVHVLQTKTDSPLNRLSLLYSNLLVRVQVLDFMKAFYISKLSLVRFKALSVISGAFGVFRRQVLLDVGGYRKTIGEDTDITLRIHRYMAKHKNMKISFIADAVGFTELPETWKDLIKQRLRWQKAYIDCIIHFRSFFGRTIFTKAVSFFYIFETFLIGTLASFGMTGIVFVNMISAEHHSYLNYLFFYLFWLFFFGLVYDLVAIGIGRHYGFSFQIRDTFRLITAILFDLFIYRFVTMYFVMYGSISYFFNKEWNKVSRTGRKYHENNSKRAA